MVSEIDIGAQSPPHSHDVLGLYLKPWGDLPHVHLVFVKVKETDVEGERWRRIKKRKNI